MNVTFSLGLWSTWLIWVADICWDALQWFDTLTCFKGVTLLAFGNGAPDVFSAIAAVENAKMGDIGLALGALLGMYSRTCLDRPPFWPWKYDLSIQVVFGDGFNYIENVWPSNRNMWVGLQACQDRWPLMAVASEERFHCNTMHVFWLVKK